MCTLAENGGDENRIFSRWTSRKFAGFPFVAKLIFLIDPD